MKKQAVTLIALVAALGLMIGAYFLVTKLGGEGEEAVTTAADNTVTLLSVDVETMTAMSYLLDGEEMSFTVENNAWCWREDKSLNLDGAKFYAMIEGMMPLTSTVKIEAPTAEQLTAFGLDAPANRVTIADGSGTHTLVIGSYNSYNACYYAAVDTTDVIYMIPAAVAEGFVYDVYDLLAYDALPTITAGKIDSVTLTRGADSTTYTYYGSGNPDYYTDTFKWFAARGVETPVAVSTTAGNSLSSAVTGLAFSDCVSYHAAEDAAKYGLADPAKMTINYRATVTTTDATTGAETSTEVNHSESILIGNVDPSSGCYYATVEGSSLIYLLSSASLPTLLEPADGFSLPTQVASVNYNFVNKITFEAGVKRLTVIIGHDAETTYTVGGETVEYSKLSSLFGAVQSLVAESTMAESAPDANESATPRLHISFTFNQGEPREAELIVTPYNTNFDRVSFMGRDDQLISIRDTEKLIELVEAYK
ncbi:MAG: DUF4340 domain-containing protein [Clostridia bacterium]|nr:DUF4340 domain-containing protein [Clostridia bacterium]